MADKIEVNEYSRDDFIGSAAPFEPMYVGFNNERLENQKGFIVTSERGDCVSIQSFKDLNGLNHAFAQGEDVESIKIVELYDRRMAILNKVTQENKYENKDFEVSEVSEVQQDLDDLIVVRIAKPNVQQKAKI